MNIDGLAFTSVIFSFDIASLTWAELVKFRIHKNEEIFDDVEEL